MDLQHQRVQANNDGDLVVALRFLPGIDLVVTIFALIKAGLAYVPIAPNWPDGRIKMLFDDCRPIWALTNIKADPLYKAAIQIDEERGCMPKIFQVFYVVFWGYDVVLVFRFIYFCIHTLYNYPPAATQVHHSCCQLGISKVVSNPFQTFFISILVVIQFTAVMVLSWGFSEIMMQHSAFTKEHWL